MKSMIKEGVRRVLPERVYHSLRHVIKNVGHERQRARAENRYAAAGPTPEYLDPAMLTRLTARYTVPPEYGWDPDAVETRGRARAAQILRWPQLRAARDTLEIGCWDGMVSCFLMQSGKTATAIDYRDVGFDPRAASAGVRLIKMDAAQMALDAQSFDFVFSYDAFEHVRSPEQVLLEAMRVTRKGGHVYLDFGPLYDSPFGEHAYESLPVPYCQFLFRPEDINEFVRRAGRTPIDFAHVNRWSLEDYRRLWKKYADRLRVVSCLESVDLSHTGLIEAYPSCFRSKSGSFETLVVDSVKILFEKIA
jgi:SAM-dependent methyltransferase